MIIWVFGSTRDQQRFVLPYQMNSRTFPNAIPIILKEVKFTHRNEYTVETHLVEIFARLCLLFMLSNYKVAKILFRQVLHTCFKY